MKDSEKKKTIKNLKNPLHNIKDIVIDPVEDEKIVPDFLKKSWKKLTREIGGSSGHSLLITMLNSVRL